ncbi:MAG: penicillin acylase family protein [Mycobacteriales bacterium]
MASAGPGAAASTSSDTASFTSDAGGFHSVLAYGQGQTVNAVDLAQNVALGSVPSTFTDQASLYNAVITKQPTTAADLARYYKSSDFSIPAGGAVESPIAGATIIRDSAHHVPHIYGATRAAGMFATGYATAEDRLFLMDVLRRTAEGSTAELLGPTAVPSDSAALGQFDRSPAELTAEAMRLPTDEGAEGTQGLADLKQYVAGINAYIAATRTDPTKLPAEYPALGTTPRDWTLADTAAEAYLLIAQFTVAGDGEEKQADILARLQRRLGGLRGQQVFDDLRRLEDPLAPVTTSQVFRSDRPGPGPASANVRIDAGSLSTRDANSSTTSPAVPAVPPVAGWVRTLASQGLQLGHHASNALLVSAAHSASGHALAAMGPQVGYYSPEILVEYELHTPGVHVSGMSFPGASPFPLIGHAATFAWTGTTALGDNADTFAETLCNPAGGAVTISSRDYLYRGRCRAFTSRTQTLHTPVAPTSPAPPETVTLTTLRSVHGPVFGYAKVSGRPVALVRSVAVVGRGLRSLVAFEKLAEGQVHSPRDFVAVMRHFTGNENWFYVSSSHIAWLASGWFQQHAAGTDVDLPINGDGQHDWVGFNPSDGSFTRMPDSFNPTAIDPAQGYLTSWNNKAAPGWHASPGTWSFGRVQRVQLLEQPTKALIRSGAKLTLPQLVGISGNAATQDLRGAEVLPDLLAALGPVSDPVQVQLVRALQQWVAAGAHRRDTHGTGYDDNSPAVLAFDAWWRQVVHDVYDPQLGSPLVHLIEGDEDLVLDQRAVATGFFDGWQSQLSSVVRAALGRGDADAPTATRCGTGTLASCRALLRSAFSSAITALENRYGTDPGGWRKPVLCPKESIPTCDENRPLTAGAVATPAQPFENRGTFHQAVEIPVELDRARAAAVRPAAASGTLPRTGGAPLLALAAVGLLLAASGLRRLPGRHAHPLI